MTRCIPLILLCGCATVEPELPTAKMPDVYLDQSQYLFDFTPGPRIFVEPEFRRVTVTTNGWNLEIR